MPNGPISWPGSNTSNGWGNMPHYTQISFTTLELKALWLIADIGYHTPDSSLDADEDLVAAAERALDKVWRAEKGMKGRQDLGAAARKGETRGPELDTRRRRTGESAA